MPRIERQIEIGARASDVFRFCHDMDRRPEWDERISRANLLSPRPIRRGSVVRIDTDPAYGGDVFSWEAEFVEYHYPSSSRLKVIDAAPSSYFADGTETWQFKKSGAGTTVTLTWEYQPRGILGRIADLLVRRRQTRQAVRQSLQNLKQTIESES